MTVKLVIDVLSALGTLGAVVVALHLARKANVQSGARDAKLQRMQALYLIPILEGLHSDLRLVWTIALFETETPNSMDEVSVRLRRVKNWAKDFENHSALDKLSTESLLLLPDIVALRISRALGLLHSLKVEISRFTPEEWHQPHHAVASKVRGWAGVQSTASDLIGVAINDLTYGANPQEIYPSGAEIHGHDDEG